MNTLHEKSPRCEGKVRRFGGRRRQCATCGNTWRVWKKKRGRKRKRASSEFAKKYLRRETLSLYAMARTQQKDESLLKIRMRHSLARFLEETPWPKIPPDAPLVVIADAMIITLNRRTYTFYSILVKPLSSAKAIITEPYIKEGPESYLGWQEAFAKLPRTTFESICALVSDGHRGLVYLARNMLWVHQRCIFHLIAHVQGRRSRWTRSRHRAEGETLYALVKEIVSNPSEEAVRVALLQLVQLKDDTDSSILKKIISGFVRYHREYRTYLYYPELELPRTSNSAESVIGSIRQLLNRAHGFRTISSLTRWVHALLKLKQTVTCNGYLSTKFPP